MSTDKDLISRIVARSNFGFISKREAMLVGTKMSEYHAAVGLSALDESPKTGRYLLRSRTITANDCRLINGLRFNAGGERIG
jgi:hypothetical protein